MSLHRNLILSLRWHRRIGLLCAIFVLFLSVTGLLLNHTSSLKLDSIKINSSILASLYGLPQVSPSAFAVGDQWLTHNGINSLYLDQKRIGQCQQPLQGAVRLNDLLHVLCQDELLLFTADGQLLEKITPLLGLPAATSALAVSDHQLLLKTPAGAVIADLDALQWSAAESLPRQWPAPQQLPDTLQQLIQNQAPAMDLEQIVLDLHSGRLFGNIGVLVMDLVAILLIILSITGFIAWNSNRQLRKKPIAKKSR